MLEVIEVFMDMFVMEPLEIFIDASLVHGGMLIEELKTWSRIGEFWARIDAV